MTDAVQKTTADPDLVIDIRGDQTGQIAVGDHIYQYQTIVSDGGTVYVLPDDVVPFTKIKPPVRLLSQADPPLLDRDEETAAALGAVRPRGTVQVTGGPGSGKSLFLTHLAHEMTKTLEDGVVHLKARGKPFGDLGKELFYAFHTSPLPTPYIPPPTLIREELTGITAAILIDDADALGIDNIGGLLDMAIDSAFVLSSRTEVVDVGADVILGGLRTARAVDVFARMHRGPVPDGPGVAELCDVLDGHPQCVVFAAKLVNAEGVHPAELAAQLSGPDPCHEVAKRLLAALPEQEARVAAFIAALDGAPVPIPQATAATQGARTGEVVRDLADAGIARSNSPHAFNPLLQDAAEELWDLDELRIAAVEQLTGWLGRRDPDDPRVVETAPMVLQLMDWAAGTGRHDETVALGEGIDGALALSGHWGSWERMHKIVLGSALDAGDAAAQGWALHQMGTKALCWGERSAAESLLGEALEIREMVGVQSAIDTTQHNLDILIPPGGGSGEDETPPDGGGGLIAAVANSLASDPMWPALFMIGMILVISLLAIPVRAWTKSLTFEPSTLLFRDLAVGQSQLLSTELVNESGKTISHVVLTIEGSQQFAIDSLSPVGDSLAVGILAAGLAQPSPGTASCFTDGDRFLVSLAPGGKCNIIVLLDRTNAGTPAARLFARKGENKWWATLLVDRDSERTVTTGEPTTTTEESTTTTTEEPTTTTTEEPTTTTTEGPTTTTSSTTAPPPSADLAVTYAVGHSQAAAGQTLTYVMTVHNHGPDPAGNTTASAALPGVTLMSVSSSQGSCSALPCNLGTVKSGSTVTVRLEAKINAGAVEGIVLTGTARVDSDVNDRNKANNSMSARTRVQAAIGLIDIDHETIEFGDAPETQQRLLTNRGSVDVSISGLSVSDPFSAEGCIGTTLGPGESCVIAVTFSAPGGPWFDVLEIAHNGEGDRRVLLKGGT